MLPLELKGLFFDFFDGIDRLTSSFVMPGSMHKEPAVTDIFLSFFDGDVTSANFNRTLSFNEFREQLRLKLAGLGMPELDCRVEFAVEGFNAQTEGTSIQADYALQLSFEDTSVDGSVPPNGWQAIYLMQAKIAKTTGPRIDLSRHAWSSESKFETIKGQPDRIRKVRDSFVGENGIKYHLYCPNEVLSYLDSENVIQCFLHSGIERRALQSIRDAGLWISSEFPCNLGDLFNNSNPACPWVKFILDHYFEPDEEAWNGVEKFYAAAQVQEPFLTRVAILERDRVVLTRISELLGRDLLAGKRERLRILRIHVAFPTYDYDLRLEGRKLSR